jgi:hypothetical protein
MMLASLLSALHTAQRAQKKGQTAPDDAANPTVPAHAQKGEKTSDGSSTTMVFSILVSFRA